MATERGIRAGRAFVELKADSSELQRGLRQASEKLRSFGAGLRSVGLAATAIGAAGLSPFLVGLRALATGGDLIDKASKRAGVAADEFQRLRFALEQSGSGGQDAEKLARSLARSSVELAKGTKTYTDAAEALGLSPGALGQGSLVDRLSLLAAAYAQASDKTAAFGNLQVLAGRSAQSLRPLLEGGSAALQEYARQFDRLGLGDSDATVGTAAALADSLNILRTASASLARTLGATVAPAIIRVAEPIAQLSSGIKQVIENNGRLVATVGGISAALVGLGVAATLAGVAIGGLATLAVSLAAGGPLAIGIAATAAAIPAIVVGIGLAAVQLARVEARTGAISTSATTIIRQFRQIAPAVRDGLGALFDAFATDTRTFAQLIALSFEEGLAEAARQIPGGGVLSALLGLDASLAASEVRRAAIVAARVAIAAARRERDAAGGLGDASGGVADTISRITRGSFSGDSRQFSRQSDSILRDQLITQRRQQATLERIEENTRPGTGGLGVFAP